MTSRSALAGLCLGASALACTGLAQASPEYPTSVQDQLMLARAPDCTLCHSNDLGGKGTISTYFGRTLLREGGQGNDDELALKAALSAMDSAHVDSDGDGVPDIDELRMGTDPNDGPGPIDPLPTPQTGCAVQAFAGGRSAAAAWLCGLLLAWLTARRSRAAFSVRKSEGGFRKSKH